MRHGAGRKVAAIAALLTACSAAPGDPAAIDSTTSTAAPVTSVTVTTTSTTVAPTTTTSTSTTTTTMPPLEIELAPGDASVEVTILQERLTGAGFYRSVIDGEYGPHTTSAVIAFHKAIGAERTEVWRGEDWKLLDDYQPTGLPVRSDEPNRIEIDHTSQLLFLVQDDAVSAILPISTGNGDYFENYAGKTVEARTPRGDFALYKHREGWHTSYLGSMYRPWYFYGGYAIHGSNSVPPTPASHGCVRVETWDADFLADYLELEMPVHIWD